MEVQTEILGSVKGTGKGDNEKCAVELVNATAKEKQSVVCCDQSTGQTLLHLAAERGLTRTNRLLMSANANIERTDIRKGQLCTTLSQKGIERLQSASAILVRQPRLHEKGGPPLTWNFIMAGSETASCREMGPGVHSLSKAANTQLDYASS
jgi:hypothetical protein